MKYLLLLLLLGIIFIGCNSENKYTVCWTERRPGRGEGHCRHNGILTDSGYTFRDTIWDHDLKKEVVVVTVFRINKNKNNK